MSPYFNPHTGTLALTARRLAEIIDNGQLFEAADGNRQLQDLACSRTDAFVAAVAEHEEAEKRAWNPCLEYREQILGHDSTAQRLAGLVLHLFNSDDWPANLPMLLDNADHLHARIALELIEHYHRYGYSDPIFMSLAAEILLRPLPQLLEQETAA